DVRAAASLASALALGARVAGFAVLLDERDDLPGDVLAGGGLDAFQARRGIHLHDERALVGAQDVDAGDVQTDDARRAHRHAAFLRRDAHGFRGAAAVQVGAELTFLRGAF